MNISPQYLAGLIDGEGYLAILPSSISDIYFSPALKLSLRYDSKYLLDMIQSQYGGNMEKRVGKANANDSYCLTIKSKRSILALLADVSPFLILKKEAALLLIEFCELPYTHPRMKNKKMDYNVLIQKKKSLAKEVKNLSWRGKALATTE